MLSKAIVLATLGISIVATMGITWLSRSGPPSAKDNGKGDFQAFRYTYLTVYLTAMMADWLQGPYVYSLYESYEINRSQNGLLFVVGFGSSALVGTFVGALADSMGRRRFAAAYCILYILSCITKHFKHYGMLMLGRLTGGIATSLLFSVFESWMVSEHISRGFDPSLLGGTFSLAVFCNSITAITAGQMGQIAADITPLHQIAGPLHYGGYTAPFDLSSVFSVTCLALLFSTWSENYGQSAGSDSSSRALKESVTFALQVFAEKPDTIMCGMVCAFFEASMYIFVFNWTPGVKSDAGPDDPSPPYGHIFSCFMVMCMCGSQVFAIITKSWSVEKTGMLALALSLASHVITAVTVSSINRFFAFLLFEFSVGMYFPMIGTLKGLVVPEEARSTIYNFYRIPLNVMVVVPLLLNLNLEATFMLTSCLLACALGAQHQLKRLLHVRPAVVDQPPPEQEEIGMVVGAKQDDDA